MAIQHLDVVQGRHSRVVFSHGFAFFTGHVAPKPKTLREQTEALLKRYDELFAQFGLKKKNILYAMCYLQNADDEEEYTNVYYEWIDKENPPAGLAVTARGNPDNATGEILLELHLIVATDPDAKIERYDVSNGSRMVKYNGLAFFTGHVYPKADTLGEQTSGVLNRYMELFAQFGLKKENVVAANAFVKNMGAIDQFQVPWNAFWGDNPPAAMAVQCPPNQNTKFGPNLQIELELIVAYGDVAVKRYEVVPGSSGFVTAGGLGFFSGHSADPKENKTMDAQVRALYGQYEGLLAKLGVEKKNLVMSYAYLSDMALLPEFLAAPKVALDPDDPPAGVAMEGVPVGEGNLLTVQFVASMDGE